MTCWTHSALLVCKRPQGWPPEIGQSIWGSSMGCLLPPCSEVLRMFNFLTLFLVLDTFYFTLHGLRILSQENVLNTSSLHLNRCEWQAVFSKMHFPQPMGWARTLPLPHQETESVEVSCPWVSVGACDTSTREWGGGAHDSWSGLCSNNSHLVILESSCQDLRKSK